MTIFKTNPELSIAGLYPESKDRLIFLLEPIADPKETVQKVENILKEDGPGVLFHTSFISLSRLFNFVIGGRIGKRKSYYAHTFFDGEYLNSYLLTWPNTNEFLFIPVVTTESLLEEALEFNALSQAHIYFGEYKSSFRLSPYRNKMVSIVDHKGMKVLMPLYNSLLKLTDPKKVVH